MKKPAAILSFLCFLCFAVLAGQGHKAGAAAAVLAGFLAGTTLAQVPPRAEREQARQREQASRNPENFTRIY